MKANLVPVLKIVTLAMVMGCNLAEIDNPDKATGKSIKSSYNFQQSRQVLCLPFDSTCLDTELFYWGIPPAEDSEIINKVLYSRKEADSNKINAYYFSINEGEQRKWEKDNKKLWFNSASSFTLNYRKHKLYNLDVFNGQGYYESDKDSLLVTLSTDSLQIAGTAGTGVYMMNYGNEPAIVIALAKGMVNLKGKYKGRVINTSLRYPGEQVLIFRNTGAIKKTNIDAEMIPTWENTGYLRCQNADLSTIFRALSRWYNMPVTFVGAMPEFSMEGAFPYSASLESVFKILEANAPIKCQLRNDSIIVTQTN